MSVSSVSYDSLPALDCARWHSYDQGATGTTLNAATPYDARDNVSSAFPKFTSTGGENNTGFLQFSGDMTGSNFECVSPDTVIVFFVCN